MLETRQLECVRDDRLLFRDLSIKLAVGEVLQIEGANGSGKTSLLRILCGLRRADDGEVLWQGEEVSDVREDYYANMIYIGH
ncbi:MAG: ATP-binding cassette domain-containing protein, partial [Gammaproteobacteria bacterium]|nr:ATP-binding cassette domain-containing protein [Gammaproteobacteria bacterium]